MYDALGQVMMDPQQQLAQQQAAQAQVQAQAQQSLGAYQLPQAQMSAGPVPSATPAPSAAQVFLHHLGTALQDQHAQNQAQQADPSMGDGGGGGGNPYAINWNPSSIKDSYQAGRAAKNAQMAKGNAQALGVAK